MDLSTAVFYLVAIVTVGSALMVAFSRNIIYSAFSLLGTFAGVAGLYVFLGADFVAAVQLLIYVGGILILILFAVMLTHRITDVEITNRAALSSYLIIGAILFTLGLFTVLTRRNAISVLMGVELILNSANINYVAFSHFGSGKADGQIYAIFVIMLAAAEAAVGLAIVLAIFQIFHTIDVEAVETLRE